MLQIERIVLEKDLTMMINTEDIEIDNLLIKFGISNNNHIGESISSFIKHKTNSNDLTLKELEKSIAAGLDEVEVFPINFVQSPDDIFKVLKIISEVKQI